MLPRQHPLHPTGALTLCHRDCALLLQGGIGFRSMARASSVGTGLDTLAEAGGMESPASAHGAGLGAGAGAGAGSTGEATPSASSERVRLSPHTAPKPLRPRSVPDFSPAPLHHQSKRWFQRMFGPPPPEVVEQIRNMGNNPDGDSTQYFRLPGQHKQSCTVWSTHSACLLACFCPSNRYIFAVVLNNRLPATASAELVAKLREMQEMVKQESRAAATTCAQAQ